MTYKALILDVDGTLVPYDYNALPSEKVKQFITKAQEQVSVCVATGRSYAFVEPVLKALSIDYGLAIVNNGAQVIDIETKKEYYSQPIAPSDISIIIELLQEEGISFYLNAGGRDIPYERNYIPAHVFNIYSRELFSQIKIRRVIKKLNNYSKISIQETNHKDADLSGFVITHALATKQHGTWEAAKILDLKRAELVGVGDGYNDFSLFSACGLKVAMGNANDDLKELADYVAPTVSEDGVAHVIEKYILKSIDEV
jgi:Cof subfamily protein (haloacid dehalogenase superfamily)